MSGLVIFGLMNFVPAQLRFLVWEMAKPTREMEDEMYSDWEREMVQQHLPRAKELDKIKARARSLKIRLYYGEGYDSDNEDIYKEQFETPFSPPRTPTNQEDLYDDLDHMRNKMSETRLGLIFAPWENESLYVDLPFTHCKYDLPASYLNLTQKDIVFYETLWKIWTKEFKEEQDRKRQKLEP